MAAAYPFLVPCEDPNDLGTLGQFTAKRLIGEGASSLIFAARDTKLKRDVALRVLKPNLIGDASARSQFLAENRAGAAVEHRNVLPVFEVCEDEDVVYAVMALNDGETLETHSDRALSEIYRLGTAMGHGLAAIHQAGYVHGDLKPSNVLVSQTGVVRLSDFGGGPENAATPYYRAPEQIDGKPSSQRADLYSLGVLLYELTTTGELPYQSRTGEALAREIVHDRPPSLLDKRADCPVWFSDLVGTLLEKAPARRPVSASEVTAMLENERFLGVKREPVTSRRGYLHWVALALVLSMIGSAIWIHRRPPQGTPAFIQGSKTRYESLAEAIADAPAGATIVVRDGLHEFASAITIDRPVAIIADAKSRPVLRSLDRLIGTVFRLEAATTLEGLTLSHELEERVGKSLIYAYAPLTLRQCRLEQYWKKDRFTDRGPAAIDTWESVSMVRTEIDATSTIGIRSQLRRSGLEPTIHVEECAIASALALVFADKGRPGKWQATLTNTHFLAGSAIVFENLREATPFLDLSNCIFDVDRLIYVLGGHVSWKTFADRVLPQMGWDGKDNLYSMFWFLYVDNQGRPPVEELRRTPPGWLSICPTATETGFYNAPHTIILPELPKSYTRMSTWMATQARWTAHDLRIQNSIAMKDYPNAGGNMHRVGPYRKR